MVNDPPVSGVQMDESGQMDELWRWCLARGSAALRRGDHETATEYFERALRCAPQESSVLIALGKARISQQRYADAERLLADAVAQRPNSPGTVALYARLVGLHLKRTDEALAMVAQTTADHPEALGLKLAEGELLLQKEDTEGARRVFEAVLDAKSNDSKIVSAAKEGLARVHNAEGVALAEQGQSDAALFSFKRASDLDREWSAPHVNVGVVLSRLGRARPAMRAYRRALECDATNPTAYFNLAAMQRALGAMAEARSTLELLLELHPDHNDARLSLAETLAELGQFDTAVSLLLDDLKINGESAGALARLGRAYICSGRPEQGEECLHRALKLDPGCREATQALTALDRLRERLSALAAQSPK